MHAHALEKPKSSNGAALGKFTMQAVLLMACKVDDIAGSIRHDRAKWFGVGATDMPTVFPNLGNFTTADLGFMA